MNALVAQLALPPVQGARPGAPAEQTRTASSTASTSPASLEEYAKASARRYRLDANAQKEQIVKFRTFLARS